MNSLDIFLLEKKLRACGGLRQTTYFLADFFYLDFGPNFDLKCHFSRKLIFQPTLILRFLNSHGSKTYPRVAFLRSYTTFDRPVSCYFVLVLIPFFASFLDLNQKICTNVIPCNSPIFFSWTSETFYCLKKNISSFRRVQPINLFFD